MKTRTTCFLLILLITTLGFAQGAPQQPAAPAAAPPPPTVAAVLDRQLTGLEKQFVPLAEAMPEDKWDYRPTTGEYKDVMTFSQMVKHVASANFFNYARILGEKPPADKNESGPAALKTRAEILQYLKDSLAMGHRALATITAENAVQPLPNPSGKGTPTRLALAIGPAGHAFDHYGQLVEYLRLNSIIPPASRKQ